MERVEAERNLHVRKQVAGAIVDLVGEEVLYVSDQRSATRRSLAVPFIGPSPQVQRNRRVANSQSQTRLME